jgi:hypothetical protein
MATNKRFTLLARWDLVDGDGQKIAVRYGIEPRRRTPSWTVQVPVIDPEEGTPGDAEMEVSEAAALAILERPPTRIVAVPPRR